MEQEPKIREVLALIQEGKTQLTSNDSLEELLGPGTRGGKYIVLHWLWKQADEATRTLIRTYIEHNPDLTTALRASLDNETLNRRLAEKALTTAVDLGMYDLMRMIAEESKPDIATETITSLLLRKEFGLLKQLIVLEVKAADTAKLSTTRRKVKRWLVGSTDNTYNLKVKDIVKLANIDRIEPSIITAFCLECGDLNDGSGITQLLRSGKEEEALGLLLANYKAPSKSLAAAISLDCYKYVVEYVRRGISIVDAKQKVFTALFTKLGKDKANMEVLLYILRRYMSDTSLQDSIAYTNFLQELLQPTEIELYLGKTLNPFKLVVQLIELATIFMQRFISMQIQYTLLIKELIRLGRKFQENVKEDQQMKLILFDKDLENRDVLSVILQYNLIDFLNTPLIENISHDVWSGSYSYTPNIMRPTSGLWHLLTERLHKDKDPEYMFRTHLFKRRTELMPGHSFEYEVWRTSAAIRMTIIGLEYLILTAALFASEMATRETGNAFDAYQSKFTDEEREMSEDEAAELNRLAGTVRDAAAAWDFVGISIMIAAGKVIWTPLFQLLTRRKQNLFSVDWLLNLTVLVFMFTLYLLPSQIDGLGLKHLGVSGDILVIKINEMIDDPTGSLFVSITIFALGARLLYLLRVTTFLGPLICIIQAIIMKIVQFALFFFMVLFIFSLCATLLFSSEDPEFQSVDIIVLTLFQASLGVFSLSPPEKYTVACKVFFVIFVFIINIMLLNLIVAILNDVYATMSVKNPLIFHKELLSLRDIFRPHKEYQFLVSSYYFVDALLAICFLPVFIFVGRESRRRLNALLLHIEYTFVFIFIFPLYLIIEVLLLPAVYVKCLISKSILVIRGKVRHKEGIWAIVRFLFFGLFILLAYVVSDCYYCIVHAYAHKPSKKRNKEAVDYVPAEVWNSIVQTVCGLRANQERERYPDKGKDKIRESERELEKAVNNHKTPDKYKDGDLDSETIISCIEGGLELTRQNTLIPQVVSKKPKSQLLGITQYASITRFIKMLAIYPHRPGLVNLKVLRDLLAEYTTHFQFRQYIKGERVLSKPLRGLRKPQIAPEDQTEMLTILNRPGEETTGSVKTLNKDKMWIKPLKVYDRLTFGAAINSFCTETCSSADVIAELKSFKELLLDWRFAEQPIATAAIAAAAYQRSNSFGSINAPELLARNRVHSIHLPPIRFNTQENPPPPITTQDEAKKIA